MWKEWKQIYPNPSQEIEWEAFYHLSKLVVESSDQDFEDEINNYLDLDNIIDYYGEHFEENELFKKSINNFMNKVKDLFSLDIEKKALNINIQDT